ncbi:MAG: peptidoglycan DD-metalloendopeptidase family protein [Bacillota bacterium]
MWIWLNGFARPETLGTAGCQTVYTDWKLTDEERLNEHAWVVAYRHYERTRTNTCTGQSTTETKTEGPTQLWPAVPRQRVVDVSRPQPHEGVASGTPLRSTDSVGREVIEVGPGTAIHAPGFLNSLPVSNTPMFPLGAVLLAGAVAYTLAVKGRRTPTADPNTSTTTERVLTPPPRPGEAPASYREENGEMVASPEVVTRSDGTWTWHWKSQYRTVMTKVEVEEEVEVKVSEQVQEGFKPVSKRVKQTRTERVKVGTRIQWEKVSLGRQKRQVPKTRLVDKDVVVGYNHVQYQDGFDIRTRKPIYRTEAVPIVEKRSVWETYYEEEWYEDFDMVPRPVDVFEDRTVEEYVTVNTVEPLYVTQIVTKKVKQMVEKEVPVKEFIGWTGEWSHESAVVDKVLNKSAAPLAGHNPAGSATVVEAFAIDGIETLDQALKMKEALEQERLRIPHQIAGLERLIPRMPEEDKKAIRQAIKELQDTLTAIPALIEAVDNKIQWFMDHLPDDLKRFKHHFVDLEKEYWHRVIRNGKSTADEWRAGEYQSLLELEEVYKTVEGYREFVSRIVAEASDIQEAYSNLHQAKTQWWIAHLAGMPTEVYKQQADAAREKLAALDPDAAALWGGTWELEKEYLSRKQRFMDVYETYWKALFDCDQDEVNRTQDELDHILVSFDSEMGQTIRTKWTAKIRKRYLSTLAVLAGAGNSDTARGYAHAQLAFWRKHLPTLSKRWEQEARGSLVAMPQSYSDVLLWNVFQPSGITEEQLLSLVSEREHPTLYRALEDDGLAAAIIAADQDSENPINALFTLARLVHETGWGTANWFSSKRNTGAFMVNKELLNFSSYQESIEFDQENLKRLYKSQGYLNIATIAQKYAPIGQNDGLDSDGSLLNPWWPGNVAELILDFGRKIGPVTANAQNDDWVLDITNSDEVRRVQQAVSKVWAGSRFQEFSGVWDQWTQAAIAQFQYFNDLPITGAADDITLGLLLDGGLFAPKRITKVPGPNGTITYLGPGYRRLWPEHNRVTGKEWVNSEAVESVAVPTDFWLTLDQKLHPPLDSLKVTDHSGTRVSPVDNKTRAHAGTDYRAVTGTTVKAIYPGKIVKVDYDKAIFGYRVVIEHHDALGTPFYSFYAHLDDVSMAERLLEEGGQVKSGTSIGLSGGTPNYAPHLHFELYKAYGPAPGSSDAKPAWNCADHWKVFASSESFFEVT